MSPGSLKAADCPVVEVNAGTLTANTVWTEGNVYKLKGQLSVQSGVQLTIQQGVIVKIPKGDYIDVNGSLRAVGAAGKEIVFTSIQDDLCGDTNGDGDNTTPLPGDWYAIRFNDQSVDSVCLLDNVIVKYGGKYGQSVSAIDLRNASPTIKNCKFESNAGYAIGCDTDSFPVISGNTMTGNEVNGIGIFVGSVGAPGGTWTSKDSPYVIDNYITIVSGARLKIVEGASVKLKVNGNIQVQGVLEAKGTETEGITFTSIDDDTVAGDTNNNADTTVPLPGAWNWIRFMDDSVDAKCILEHALIRYGGTGGGQPRGAVDLMKASPTVASCTFEKNAGYAMSCDEASFPSVSGCTMTENDVNGIGIFAGTIAAPGGAWKCADSPYVLDSYLAVGAGARLKVEPGVTVKLKVNGYIQVDGVLEASGTDQDKIVLTSINDDSADGDTNNDKDMTVPLPGDWGWIRFRDQSVDANCVMEQVALRYGGKYSSQSRGMVDLDTASPTIRSCTFERSAGYAISVDTASYPVTSGNIAKSNTVNAIGVYTGTIQPPGGTWALTDLVYVMDGHVNIAQGARLKINPGVIVKCQANTQFNVSGTLEASGAPGAPIVFTALSDDTLGGDTNNDGATSVPLPGSWQYIIFEDQSLDSNCVVENCVVRYGGAYGGSRGGAIYARSASPKITGNDIAYNYRGIELRNGSESVVSKNCIHDNTEEGVYVEGASPDITENNITLNKIGVHNATWNACVKAKGNWWGCGDGPADTSDKKDACDLGRNDGRGDAVSDDVDYTEWATSALPCSDLVQKSFHRGDSNNDGDSNLSDAVYILNHLFMSGCEPVCMESADVNDDGGVNITDGIYLLNHLFLGGPALAPPGSTRDPCGVDPADSPSNLGCVSYSACP